MLARLHDNVASQVTFVFKLSIKLYLDCLTHTSLIQATQWVDNKNVTVICFHRGERYECWRLDLLSFVLTVKSELRYTNVLYINATYHTNLIQLFCEQLAVVFICHLALILRLDARGSMV